MSKRKLISILDSLGKQTGFPKLDRINSIISFSDIMNKVDAIKQDAEQTAYNNYNASMYPVNIPPTSTQIKSDIDIIEDNTNKTKSSSYNGKQEQFVSDIYDSYYKAVRPKAMSDEDAARQAEFLTQKAAFETGYGKHVANTHNYGGHRTKNKGWLAFNSMDDFTEKDVALLDKKWSNWRNSKTSEDFVNSITTNNGYGVYAPRHEYQGYLNMNKRRLSRAGEQNRPKAWIGAVLGAATGILGSVFSANAQAKRAREQRRLREHQAAVERADSLNQSLGLMQAAQQEYENRFRRQFAKGGKEKNIDFKITDGGVAIPIGNNTFLLRGSSHNQVNESGQTGIGLKVYSKGGAAKHNEIEAETGEVVEVKPDELRIYSDSIGINGHSFADLVQMGYNKDRLFKIQQAMNGNYNGKRKLRVGGKVCSPVGRTKAEFGLVQTVNGGYQKRVKYPNSNNYYWQSIPKSEYNRLIAKGYRINNPPTTANSPIKQTSKRTTVTNPPTTATQSYLTGNARSSNPAPYNSIQIGATTPALNAYTLPDYSKDIDTYFAIRDIKGTPITSNADTTSSKATTSTTPTTTTTTAPTKRSGTTKNRTLASAGRPKSVAAQTNTSNVPDYSSQEYADYIKTQPYYSQPKVESTAEDTTPHFTNPADRDLYEYMQTFQKNGTTPQTKKDVDTETENSNNKLGATFKGSDWIGLGADVIGSLAGAYLQAKAADTLSDPLPPVRVSPAKLITNWNIEPRLSAIRNTRDSMLKDTDEVVSSATRLNKRNAIKLYANTQENELYGEKTNKVTELLNQDALNQQSVHVKNVEDYNRYLENLINTRNSRRLGRVSALQAGLSGLSDAVGNFLDQGKQRYADQQAMRYYTALLPSEGREWLKRNGVDFLKRGGRIK